MVQGGETMKWRVVVGILLLALLCCGAAKKKEEKGEKPVVINRPEYGVRMKGDGDQEYKFLWDGEYKKKEDVKLYNTLAPNGGRIVRMYFPEPVEVRGVVVRGVNGWRAVMSGRVGIRFKNGTFRSFQFQRNTKSTLPLKIGQKNVSMVDFVVYTPNWRKGDQRYWLREVEVWGIPSKEMKKRAEPEEEIADFEDEEGWDGKEG
jgi:hypothetical protein